MARKPPKRFKLDSKQNTHGIQTNSSKANSREPSEPQKEGNKPRGRFSPIVKVQNARQRNFRVKKIMIDNSALGNRKAIKVTKKDYKAAQKKYKAKSESYKQLKNALKKSTEAASEESTTEINRSTLMDSEKSSSLEEGSFSSQAVRARTFSKAKLEKEVTKAAAEKAAAKEDLKIAKAVRNKTKAADPTSLSSQLQYNSKAQLKRQGENELVKDDTLLEAVKIRQDSRQRTSNYQAAKFVIRSEHRMNMKLVKGSYGLSNRSYNYVRGKGFQRTPESLSYMHKAAKKYRNFNNRLKASKFGRAAASTKRFMSGAARVINAPLKTRNILILTGILLFITTIFMFIPLYTPLPIQQDEFDLTDSWTHMTKVDADRSDETYLFYTPLDEVMFYMNYVHEDYKLDDKMAILTFKTYRDHLSDIWGSMNNTKGDSYKFTGMFDLAKDKDSDYYMDPDDFEEMKENVEEFGYSSLDGQLSFPYETDNLPITRRFGYEVNEDKVNLHANIEVEIKQNENIVAPMAGTIRWYEDQNKVILDDENGSKLILSGMNTKRHFNGEEVSEGELIGRASSQKLTISYEKFDEESKKSKRVNPAFYFPSVTYRQKTVITEPFDPGGSLQNAQYIKNKLTDLGYKLEGICAIIANFDIESGVNPKRAEGDYLPPPIGASGNCWDDDGWLSIGGMQIYGRYPNIIHRGLGLGQWTDTADGGTRHTLLRNFAKSKNKKWYTIDLQLDFMLNGDVPASRTIFKQVASGSSANGVAALTRDFLVRWEGNPGDKLAQRVQSAENWFKYFSQNPGGNGDYILPLNPPNISSWFGWRSMGDFHRGLDFAHPQGTPIRAISDGTVLTAEYHYSWGNYVHLKHSNGQSSLYAHCSALKVKPGDQIKQGDVVGLVGNTGNSFGAHLHLEISKSTDLSMNSLLDPASVLGISK